MEFTLIQLIRPLILLHLLLKRPRTHLAKVPIELLKHILIVPLLLPIHPLIHLLILRPHILYLIVQQLRIRRLLIIPTLIHKLRLLTHLGHYRLITQLTMIYQLQLLIPHQRVALKKYILYLFRILLFHIDKVICYLIQIVFFYFTHPL